MTETILIAAAAAAGAMAVATVLTELVAHQLWMDSFPNNAHGAHGIATTRRCGHDNRLSLRAPRSGSHVRTAAIANRSCARIPLGGSHPWRNGLLAVQVAATTGDGLRSDAADKKPDRTERN
jgi:hypothetical protein